MATTRTPIYGARSARCHRRVKDGGHLGRPRSLQIGRRGGATRLPLELAFRSSAEVRSTVIDDQTPLSRWSCRGFRASSPSSRPSRSKSAADGTSSVAISPRRGAMPSSAILDGLRAKLAQSLPREGGGDKALVGNSGFRRYLKTVSAEHFAVDETRVAEDARFDGLYVLRTNTKLTPLQVMLR